jgi:DNA modification methylase
MVIMNHQIVDGQHDTSKHTIGGNIKEMDTLGKYKIDNIYNEDCYSAIRNIPDKSIDLIYTDPPYEFGSGGCAGIAKERKFTKEIFFGKMDYGINTSILDEFVRVMKRIYIYMVQ